MMEDFSLCIFHTSEKKPKKTQVHQVITMQYFLASE